MWGQLVVPVTYATVFPPCDSGTPVSVSPCNPHQTPQSSAHPQSSCRARHSSSFLRKCLLLLPPLCQPIFLIRPQSVATHPHSRHTHTLRVSLRTLNLRLFLRLNKESEEITDLAQRHCLNGFGLVHCLWVRLLFVRVARSVRVCVCACVLVLAFRI